jgi:hypothetical protein
MAMDDAGLQVAEQRLTHAAVLDLCTVGLAIVNRRGEVVFANKT